MQWAKIAVDEETNSQVGQKQHEEKGATKTTKFIFRRDHDPRVQAAAVQGRNVGAKGVMRC
jgi:hypothetical protein